MEPGFNFFGNIELFANNAQLLFNGKIIPSEIKNFDENKEEALTDIKKRKIRSYGQGFGLSAAERKTIENYAMKISIEKMSWTSSTSPH